ncbi:MAG TPA: ribbon-helix-helix protein, CopG family, partial [Nitrospirae bacterium]|nr:ribbon-helix-helix protein, CopG family [Nitrospirota bacterium]
MNSLKAIRQFQQVQAYMQAQRVMCFMALAEYLKTIQNACIEAIMQETRPRDYKEEPTMSHLRGGTKGLPRLICGIDIGRNNSYTYFITKQWRKNMKTAISIPDKLFKDIERLSKELNLPRSRILAEAARDYIEKQKNKKILEALNKVYSEKETGEEKKLREKGKKRYAK